MSTAVLAYVCLIGWLVEAMELDSWQIEKGHAICSAYGYKLVAAKFAKEEHLLCLKLKAIGMRITISCA